MLLLNYLARKRTESGLVAGFTISVPWDATKSSVSMEEPLNWLLFNKYLTTILCGLITRSSDGLGFHKCMNLVRPIGNVDPLNLFLTGTGRFWRK